MTLSIAEYDRMQYLLGKSRVSSLTLFEQNELRKYIEREQPNAQNVSIDDLIALGLIIVGLYALYKIFEK